MFLLMAVPADMCATSSYNIRPSVFFFIIFMNFHFQYGGLKPEVVIFSLLMKIFEKFQILVICFRPWPFQCTCARHRPTMSDTQKNPIWRLGNRK
jgi:ammonia channel protein AmtB